MADKTKIEWTEATWNPITGCSVHSAGCTNCYAMKLAGTRLQHHPSRSGLTLLSKAGSVWTGEVRFNEQWLTQPLRWEKPRMIFVCAHADLFHESVPVEWIDRIFAVMALCPQHTFQVLTKRSARMREYLCDPQRGEKVQKAGFDAGLERKHSFGWETYTPFGKVAFPLRNVWLGVSVENQAAADERIPDLLATPAAVRWISAEPLLGPVHIGYLGWPNGESRRRSGISALVGARWDDGVMVERLPKLDWVVAGGESGKGARPMYPDWARNLRDQCAAAGTPFFFKQWGEWHPMKFDDPAQHGPVKNVHVFKSDGQWMVRKSKKNAHRLLDGMLHNGMPA